ncbi:hypothetical protein [Prosthecobacter sp.]|uniref:hypothetical protein n=1 Tax=Prosthecobacter sp. TaxID=1965333 RepID=UPI00378470EE
MHYPVIMGDPAHIPFPVFRRYRIRESLPLCALLTVAAVLLYPYWRIPALFCAAGAVWIMIPRLLTDIRNALMRRRWLRQFQRRIAEIEIVPLISQHPGRYAAHVCRYSGFDLNAVKPLAYLEDLSSGECTVVSPSSWQLPGTLYATALPCTNH